MRTIGLQQLMSASLYSDDAQLDSFTKTLVRTHCDGLALTVVGEPRVAYHFGQLVHANDCAREFVIGDGGQLTVVGSCSDDCAIVDCDEDDATVVMMRVEVDVDA